MALCDFLYSVLQDGLTPLGVCRTGDLVYLEHRESILAALRAADGAQVLESCPPPAETAPVTPVHSYNGIVASSPLVS
jgi:hypothetical protein